MSTIKCFSLISYIESSTDIYLVLKLKLLSKLLICLYLLNPAKHKHKQSTNCEGLSYNEKF